MGTPESLLASSSASAAASAGGAKVEGGFEQAELSANIASQLQIAVVAERRRVFLIRIQWATSLRGFVDKSPVEVRCSALSDRSVKVAEKMKCTMTEMN